MRRLPRKYHNVHCNHSTSRVQYFWPKTRKILGEKYAYNSHVLNWAIWTIYTSIPTALSVTPKASLPMLQQRAVSARPVSHPPGLKKGRQSRHQLARLPVTRYTGDRRSFFVKRRLNHLGSFAEKSHFSGVFRDCQVPAAVLLRPPDCRRTASSGANHAVFLRRRAPGSHLARHDDAGACPPGSIPNAAPFFLGCGWRSTASGVRSRDSGHRLGHFLAGRRLPPVRALMRLIRNRFGRAHRKCPPPKRGKFGKR